MSNRILLTNQLLQSFNKSGIRVGCRAAGFESWTDIDADVQIISGQTESARVLKRRKKTGDDVQLHPADVLLLDEAHIQKGDETRRIIREYQDKYGAIVIGISATPLGIGDIYKHLIVAGNNSELRRCGALVPAKCYEPAVIDLPKIKRSKTGVFSQNELEIGMRAIWSQHIVGHVFNHWRIHNPDSRPSLGMAPGVKESIGLAEEYWRRGVNAAHIDSSGIYVNGKYHNTNAQEDRDELFAMMADGRVPQVFNRFVLREAIDLPWLYMLQIATPIASLTSYVQVCGRVLRSHPSKTEALIADHCGVMRMHGSPNDDRDDDWKRYFYEVDTDKITKDRQELLRSPDHKEPEPITCPKCKMVRNKGAVCPGCQFEHTKSTRMVIQESGELKESTKDVYPRRRVRQYSDTEAKWLKCFMQKKRSDDTQTFSQVRGWFVHQHHYYPVENLPYMPKHPADWSRRICDVSYADLIPREVNANQ